MAATLRIGQTSIIIRHGEVKTDDVQLRKRIERINRERPSGGADPNPDLNLARIVIQELGGELLGHDETPYIDDPDVVY